MTDILTAFHLADVPVLIGVLSLLGALIYSLFHLCQRGR